MKYRTLLLFFIGIGVLMAMVIFIGPFKIEEALKTANPWYVALAVILQFVVYGIWTERWSVNIESVGISVKKRHLLPMLLVGLAINNLTPTARGGGEPIRAYLLSKYSRSPMEKSFATVMADRGLDTVPFVFLAVITIIFTVLYLKLEEWIVISLTVALAVLLTAFLLVFYLSINRKVGKKVTLWLVRVLKRFSRKEHSNIERGALNAMRGFQDSIRAMLRDKKVLFYGLPLSFLIWFLEILRVYVIFSAFDAQVSLGVIAAVFVLATLIGLLPLLPGGLGAVDGMMILLFSYAGVPPSVSAAATIVERLISFWMTSILGITIIPYFGWGLIDKLSSKLQ